MQVTVISGDHPDTVVFTGEAADEPLDLAGPVDLVVRVTSSAPTTDVFAKLCDLAPDGSLHQIARGQVLLDHPSEREPHRIGMGHTGYRLRPGHRLQLLIAASDFPEFAPNSGTDENRWTVSQRHGSEQRLVTDATSPAWLSLHVLPPSD